MKGSLCVLPELINALTVTVPALLLCDVVMDNRPNINVKKRSPWTQDATKCFAVDLLYRNESPFAIKTDRCQTF